MFTPSPMLPLVIQSSPNHTITLTVTTEARRLKPYMSHLETLGGANQLRYSDFGQLQLLYILELCNSSFPKSFSPTSIAWYPSIYSQLLLGFCFLWENAFFNSILETKDFIRWCCILRPEVIQSLCIYYKYMLFEMIIFYTT